MGRRWPMDGGLCFDGCGGTRALSLRHEIVDKLMEAFVSAQVANCSPGAIMGAPRADAKLRTAVVGDEPMVRVEHFRSADVA